MANDTQWSEKALRASVAAYAEMHLTDQKGDLSHPIMDKPRSKHSGRKFIVNRQPSSPLAAHNAVSWRIIEAMCAAGPRSLEDLTVGVRLHVSDSASSPDPLDFVSDCIMSGWLVGNG
jgi:hypothetical protein